MASCEKCWADSYRDRYGDQVTRYGELIRLHTCTPEQQAGEDAGECPRCHRMTLHQHCQVCMNPDCPRDARAWLAAHSQEEVPEPQDICGLCGKPGADKIPCEQVSDTELVHKECEREECRRAHAAMTDTERQAFLETIR